MVVAIRPTEFRLVSYTRTVAGRPVPEPIAKPAPSAGNPAPPITLRTASSLALTPTDAQTELRALVARLEAHIRAFERHWQAATDEAWLRAQYRELLGREADPLGLASHMEGLRTGQSRDDVRMTFLRSAEYQQRRAQPNPVSPPARPAGPREPGAPLQTVPLTAEHVRGAAHIDRSSPAAAARSAAEWVKKQHPDWFPHSDDRAAAYRIMTEVIGVLRAAGYDAHRVVNHPSRTLADPLRYGSDAVVLNQRIYDVYVAFGERNEPTAQDMGPYASNRLRE